VTETSFRPTLVSLALAAMLLSGCVTSSRTGSPHTAPPIAGQHANQKMTPIQNPEGAVVVLPKEEPATRRVNLTDGTGRTIASLPLNEQQPTIQSPAIRTPPTRSVSPTDSNTSLISLYGNELVRQDHNAATPFDGSANTHQVSFATDGSTFDPHVDRTGQTLLFASTRHRATADIYAKSVNGTAVTQLTADPGHDMMPSLDPTGRFFAFSSDRSGNWDIYYKPMAGGQPVRLTNDDDAEMHPTWSPDGRWLAYCRYGQKTSRWEIWAVEVANPATPRFLTFGVFPVWSPDVANSKLLFQRARQRGSQFHSVWTIDFIDGETHRPTEIVSAGNAALINPAWSPDGRKIVFVSVVDPEVQPAQPTHSDVWCINVDGSQRTNLTNGHFANYQPVWSADGTIYFVSNRSGVENIWAIDTSSSTASPGTPNMASVDLEDD
jgi:TolB protein